MAKKQKKRNSGGHDDGGFGGVFGDLLAARGLVSEATKDASPSPVTTTEPAFSWSAHPRLRVRLQKKNRGGKKVTRIEGVTFEGDSGKAPAKVLGKALGCRAFVEDGALFVQGDQRQRLVTWLTAQGVKRVDPC